MKKMIVSSTLILSMTAFVINFCACGTKKEEPVAEQVAQEEQRTEQIPGEEETAAEGATRGLTTNGKVVELADEGQFNQLIAQGNVVVDFYAVWCGPCKQLAPIVHDLAKENKHVTFIKVNTESFPALSAKYSVKSIPTLVFFKNGQKQETSKGAPSKSSLQSKLNSMFKR